MYIKFYAEPFFQSYLMEKTTKKQLKSGIVIHKLAVYPQGYPHLSTIL